MSRSSSGPAILVTAAFIGPGTVITASRAGADFGHALLWALVFSVVATMILQEMTGRLGVVTGKGLGENLRDNLSSPITRFIAIILVTSAIVIGNAAYQGGNISGAVLAIAPLTPWTSALPFTPWPVVIGIFAFSILWRGKYGLIETSLKVLVGLMSLAFLATFFITKPSLAALFEGLIPTIPDGATLNIIALIGTTVVPYNLFLHASSVSEKWHSDTDISENINAVRRDLYTAIPLGGLISIAILSTAASAFFETQIELYNLATLAPSLQPLLGDFAPIIMASGLFAAGISSAITAPLAAAFALRGILGLRINMNHMLFRASWAIILILGVVLSSLEIRPVTVIWFAQVANGLLLPIITIYLIWLMNQNTLGDYKNTALSNILSGMVLIVTLMLSGRSLASAFGLI